MSSAASYRPRLSASLGEQFERMHAAITLEGDEPPEQLVDEKEAERILGAGTRAIRSARAEGHVQCFFAVRGGRMVPAYSRGELEAIVTTLDWPSASAVAKRIGLPLNGVEQLCAMNEIVWSMAPHRTLKPGLTVKPDSSREFENALRKSAIPASHIDNPVTLTAAMRGAAAAKRDGYPFCDS